MVVSLPAAPDMPGTEAISACVYGCEGCSKIRSTGPHSTMRPAYITATRLHILATTPKSWVINKIAIPVSSLETLQQLQILELDRHVERGGRLIGYEHLRMTADRYGADNSLLHAAAELVRELADALGRRRDLDPTERARRPPS